MVSEENVEQLIVDALRTASTDSASPETIKGLLAEHEGVRPSEEDVRAKADALVDQGRLELVREGGGDRRYRLTDSGA